MPGIPAPASILKKTPKSVTSLASRKNIVRVLTGVQRLFKSKRHWAIGDLAFDNEGNVVPPHYPEAQTFCLLGACERLNGRDSGYAFWGTKVLDPIAARLTNNSHEAAGVNDTQGLPAVRKLLREAIKVYSKPAPKA